MSKTILLKCLIVFAVLFSSCVDDSEKYFVSYDMKEWPFLDKLPVMPDSVTWGSLQLGSGGGIGPTDHSVQAVIYYNDSSFQELLGRMDTSSSRTYPLSLTTSDFQSWFPVEVKAAFYRDGARYVSGDRCFSLEENEAWRTSCLVVDRNILFLTYTTN